MSCTIKTDNKKKILEIEQLRESTEFRMKFLDRARKLQNFYAAIPVKDAALNSIDKKKLIDGFDYTSPYFWSELKACYENDSVPPVVEKGYQCATKYLPDLTIGVPLKSNLEKWKKLLASEELYEEYGIKNLLSIDDGFFSKFNSFLIDLCAVKNGDFDSFTKKVCCVTNSTFAKIIIKAYLNFETWDRFCKQTKDMLKNVRKFYSSTLGI
jgi:hypothetical protein